METEEDNDASSPDLFWLSPKGRERISNDLINKIKPFIEDVLKHHRDFETLQQQSPEVLVDLVEYFEAAIGFQCFTAILKCAQIYLTPWDYKEDDKEYIADLQKSLALTWPSDAMFNSAQEVYKQLGLTVKLERNAIKRLIPQFANNNAWIEIAEWIIRTSDKNPPVIGIIHSGISGWDFALRRRNHYSMRLGLRMLAFDSIEMFTRATRLLSRASQNQSLKILRDAEQEIVKMFTKIINDGTELFSQHDFEVLRSIINKARNDVAAGKQNVVETTRLIYGLIQSVLDTSLGPLITTAKNNLAEVVKDRDKQAELVRQLEQQRAVSLAEIENYVKDIAALKSSNHQLDAMVSEFQNHANALLVAKDDFKQLERLAIAQTKKIQELQEAKDRLEDRLATSQMTADELKTVISRWAEAQAVRLGITKKAGDKNDNEASLRRLQLGDKRPLDEPEIGIGIDDWNPDELIKMLLAASKARYDTPTASGDFKGGSQTTPPETPDPTGPVSKRQQRSAVRSQKNKERKAEPHIPTTPDDIELNRLIDDLTLTVNSDRSRVNEIPKHLRKQAVIDLLLDWRKQAYLMNSVDYQPCHALFPTVSVPPSISEFQKYWLNWAFSSHSNLKQQHQEWIRQWILREQQKAISKWQSHIQANIDLANTFPEKPGKKRTRDKDSLVQQYEEAQKRGEEIINKNAELSLARLSEADII